MKKLMMACSLILILLFVASAAFAYDHTGLNNYFVNTLGMSDAGGWRAYYMTLDLFDNLASRNAWKNAGLINFTGVSPNVDITVTSYGTTAIPAMNALTNAINANFTNPPSGYAESMAKALFMDDNMRNTWSGAGMLTYTTVPVGGIPKTNSITLTAYGNVAIVAINNLTNVFKAAPIGITESGVADAMAQALFTGADMRTAWVNAGLISVTTGDFGGTPRVTSITTTAYGNVAIKNMYDLTNAIKDALIPIYGTVRSDVPGGLAESKAQTLYTIDTATRNKWVTAGIITVTPYAADPTKPDAITLTAYGATAIEKMQRLTNEIRSALGPIYPAGVPNGIAESRAEALFIDSTARSAWADAGLINVTYVDSKPTVITLTDYGRTVTRAMQELINFMIENNIYTSSSVGGKAEYVSEQLFLNPNARAAWSNMGLIYVQSDKITGKPLAIYVSTYGFVAIPKMQEMVDHLNKDLNIESGAAENIVTNLFTQNGMRNEWKKAGFIDISTSSQGYSVWGISPAQNPAKYDSYMELWTPQGIRANNWYLNTTGVITPHASILALDVSPKEAMANINAIRANYAGAYDSSYGFHDTFNVNGSDYSTGFIAIDQAMILVSIANALQGGVVQNYFSTSSVVSGKTGLLNTTFSGMSAPAQNVFDTTTPLTDTEKNTLNEIAAATWNYFKNSATAGTNWLPANKANQSGAALDLAAYTSISDIGLYLMSVVSAYETGNATANEAATRIQNCVNTLKLMEKWNGLFRNYYSNITLDSTSTGDRFVSSVDNGWLATGLIVASQLFSTDTDPVFTGLSSIRDDMNALVSGMEWNRLYNGNYLATGFDDETQSLTGSNYDIMYTEIRPALLIAIGTGKVEDAAWGKLRKTLPADWAQSQEPVNGYYSHVVDGVTYKYIPSWAGSMFEGLMPNLVLNNRALSPNGLAVQDAVYTFLQKHYATDATDPGYDPLLSPLRFTAAGDVAVPGMMALGTIIQGLLPPEAAGVASGMASVMYMDKLARQTWSGAGIIAITSGTMDVPVTIEVTAYGQSAIPGIYNFTKGLIAAGVSESVANGTASSLFTDSASRAMWSTTGFITIVNDGSNRPTSIALTPYGVTAVGSMMSLTNSLISLGMSSGAANYNALKLFSDAAERTKWAAANVITVVPATGSPTSITITDPHGRNVVGGMISLTNALIGLNISESKASGITSVMFFDSKSRTDWADAGFITVDNPAAPESITVTAYGSVAIPNMIALANSFKQQLSYPNEEAEGAAAVLFLYASDRATWLQNGWINVTINEQGRVTNITLTPTAPVYSPLGDLYADFGTEGFWKHSNNTWTALSTNNVQSFVLSEPKNDKYDMIGDFGSVGLWKCASTGEWTQLSTNPIESFTLSDTYSDKYDMIGDFGSVGLWKYASTGEWTQLSANNVQSFLLSGLYSGNYDMIGDFGSIGMWKYASTGEWTHLSTNHAESFALSDVYNDKYDMIGDFGSVGLWKYASTGEWTLLSQNNVKSFALSELYNGGYDMIGDFGSVGLWKYASTGEWTLLSQNSPESFLLSKRGSNGNYDIIADFGATGLWQHSASNGEWTQLSDKAIDPEVLQRLDVQNSTRIYGKTAEGGYTFTGALAKGSIKPAVKTP